MTTLHWIWLAGGFVLASAAATSYERFEADAGVSDGDWVAGCVFVLVWFFAPIVAAGLAACALLAAISALARIGERHTPHRPSRHELTDRIAELERALEIER